MTLFRLIAHIHHIGSNWTLQPGVEAVAAKRQIENLTANGPRIRPHSGGIQEVVCGLVDQTILPANLFRAYGKGIWKEA